MSSDTFTPKEHGEFNNVSNGDGDGDGDGEGLVEPFHLVYGDRDVVSLALDGCSLGIGGCGGDMVGVWWDGFNGCDSDRHELCGGDGFGVSETNGIDFSGLLWMVRGMRRELVGEEESAIRVG
ncbi:hypothetical protein CsSME_00020334 [Camellia sinensis var. sinensis]